MRDEKQQKTLDEILKRKEPRVVGEWADNPGTDTYRDKMLAQNRILRTNKVEA